MYTREPDEKNHSYTQNAIGVYCSRMVFPYRFKLTALSSCALFHVDDGLRTDSHSHKTHSHKIIFWIFFPAQKKKTIHRRKKSAVATYKKSALNVSHVLFHLKFHNCQYSRRSFKQAIRI